MQSNRGFEYGVKHIISPQSGRLSDVLLSILDLDPAQTDFLLDLGSVYFKGQRIRENLLIQTGDYLRIHTKPRRFLSNDHQWSERIVFESTHMLVVNKPSGLPVHGSVDNLKENLQAYLEEYTQSPTYITHRLDVPTRGLIVYAKTKEFQTAFNHLVANREVRKIYRCKVEGNFSTLGVLKHYMEPSPRAPKKVSRNFTPGWQDCALEVLSAKSTGENSELTIHLLTGRTHQIRAQLAHEGFPILGDFAYGASKISDEERIELESCELSFQNPLTGEQHHFKTATHSS